MGNLYVMAKWIYGDHLPYYELVSIHSNKESAFSEYEVFIKGIEKVQRYKTVSAAEGMIAGATYIENGGALFVNDLIVYEVEQDKRIELTNSLNVNQ